MSATSTLMLDTWRWLVLATVTAVVLTPVAGVVCRALRTKSAAVRHQVWLYVLLAVVLLPVMRTSLPKTGLAVWPDRYGSMAGAGVASPAAGLRAPRQAASLASRGPSAALPDSSASLEALGASEGSWRPWILALWFVGLCAMLGRLAVGAVRLRGLRRRARPVPAEQLRVLGAAVPAPLLLSHEIEGPATWGLLRPVVVLPAAALEATDGESLRMILEHECAHIRRRDHLAVLFQRLIEAALFFHPCVWYASRELTRERELVCDRHVLWSGRSATEYVRLLARMIEQGWGSPLGAAAALFEGNLVSRVRSLLDPGQRGEPELSRRSRLVAGTLVAAALLAFGTIRLEAGASAQAPRSETKAGARPAADPEEGTVVDPIREAMKPVVQAIVRYWHREGRLPEDLAVLGEVGARDPNSPTAEGFHYEPARNSFVLSSCGPDGQYGNDDDRVLYFTEDARYPGRRFGTRAEMSPLPDPDVDPDAQIETFMPDRPRPSGNCTISGRVVSARNGDPIDHATVYLFHLDTHAPAFVRVARDGSFRFEGVAPGRYWLRSTSTAGYQEAAYDPDGSDGTSGLVLADGQTLSGVVLELKPAYSLAGRVQGDGLEGLAVVAVAERSGEPGGLETVGQERPGPDGAYRIDGLDGRPVYVMVTDWNRLPDEGGYCPQYFPGTFTREEARPVTFGAGPDVTQVDIRLARTGGRRLEGTVRDEEGRPVPGAHIVAHRSVMSFDLVPTYTDDQGRYAMSCLGAGEYLVHADATQHNLVRTRRTIETVGSEGPTRLDFVLHRGVRITGRLADEKGRDWKVGSGYGWAFLTSQPEATAAFSLTGFENRNRGRNVRIPSGSEFNPGEGDYASSQMTFPSESTFLLEGVMPGDTRIRFEPKTLGKVVTRILRGGVEVKGAVLATRAGDDISDLVVVIGDAPS